MDTQIIMYGVLAVAVGIIGGCVGTHVYARKMEGIAGGLAHFLIAPIALSHFLEKTAGIFIPSFILGVLSGIMVAFLLPIDDEGNIEALREIHVLWGVGMAFGIFLIFLIPTDYDVEDALFGSLMTMGNAEALVTGTTAIVVLLVQVLFGTRFHYIGVDDVFLRLRGVRIRMLHRLQLSIICISVVVLLESVGILMLVGVTTIPTAIAALFAKNYRLLMIYAITLCTLVTVGAVWANMVFDVQFSSFAVLFLGGLYFVMRTLFRRKQPKSRM